MLNFLAKIVNGLKKVTIRSQKVRSKMFDWNLNTPLKTMPDSALILPTRCLKNGDT